MKIAYIIPSLANSGPVKVVYQLVEELLKEHEIVIYYFKELPNRELLLFSVPTKQIGFFEKIDFDQYDVIHSHGLIPDTYVWWNKKYIKKAKTVTTLHNYVKEDLYYTYGKVKSFFLVKLWNLVTSKYDQIVVLSKDAVIYYKKFWQNQNITYVYNGVIKIDLIQRKKENRHIDYIKIGAIASAGGISRSKGLDQVIKALPALEMHRFFIVGKETEETNRLKDLARQLDVGNRVKFLGYHSDIESFIDDMDIFVVSPRSEGFSLSLQEIVRQKKPVVCSSIPIFQELFSDNEVRFFTIGEIESLVIAIKDITEGKDTLVENAYKKFLSMYTTEKMAENYLAIYAALVKV